VTVDGGGSSRVRAGIPGRPWWRWLLLVNAGLAVPTAIAPAGHLASLTYLLGEVFLTGALFAAARSRPARDRRPWYLLTVVSLAWFVGDTVQRVLEVLNVSYGKVGPPDIFWLGSYLLEILAVSEMIRLRRLPRAVVRDIRLDVLTVFTAAGLGVWLVIVEPQLGSSPTLLNTVVALLYPLGDVFVFSLAMTILLVPGSGGTAAGLLVAGFGAALPLDFLFQYLSHRVPAFDTGHLDAGFLVLNTALGAAALHPSGSRLTAPARHGAGQHLQMWRVGVLGLSLSAVSLTNAFTEQSGLARIPSLAATLVVALTIVLRFYRMARAQERAATALRDLAEHDQLTGAANRELLRRRLPEFVAGPRGLLVYIDLDGFKVLNDTHGHHIGDAVLCAVTERLGRMVRDSDTLARIGGDEFVVLLHDCGATEAPALSARILADMRAPVAVGPLTVQVGASIGVVVLDDAVAPEPGLRGPAASRAALGRPHRPHRPHEADPGPARETLAEDVMRSADAAMYDVKRRGGGVHIVRYEGHLAGVS
jgi:diguanylate cyclase (GGDEF)-like protein